MELTQKHEAILGRRTELLEQMKIRREQLNILRRQRVQESDAARSRNATIQQGLQKIEDRFRGRHLPHPHLLVLETRYWVSVEESIPAWEHFLLGKGPNPTDGPGRSPRRVKQNLSTALAQGLPPRPKPRATK